jgi:hypothetical protein
MKDYLHPEKYPKGYEEILEYIRKSICEKLKDHPNFEGLDFMDVSGGVIDIRGFHKEVKGYAYTSYNGLKYDFSNAEESIEEFIRAWKNQDNEGTLMFIKNFINDGKKWGWH